MTEDYLVKWAFNESCCLKRDGHLSWVNSCRLYLETCGIDSNPNKIKWMISNHFKSYISPSLRKCYERYWSNEIKSNVGPSNKWNGTLRTYATFKGHFQYEPYTKITNKSLTRCFAKFRCNDHSLRVETRWRENLPFDLRTKIVWCVMKTRLKTRCIFLQSAQSKKVYELSCMAKLKSL